MQTLNIGLAADLTFTDRLREAIGTKPLDRLAREAGIDRRTMRRILNGDRKHGAYTSTIETLAKALGVRPAWLAFGDGEKAAPVEVAHAS